MKAKRKLRKNGRGKVNNIKEVKVYSVPNYGSAITPDSVLAFWVLTSVLKTEAPKFKGVENLTIRHKYFGKLIKIINEKAVQLHDILINYINVLKNYLLFLKFLNKKRWGYK